MSDEARPGEKVRPSATVILTRGAEVYLVERSRKTRFFPGYHVFPGGVLDKGDGEGEPARRVAALRELFEEAGVLCVTGDASTFPRDEARALLRAGESVAPLLTRHGLAWDVAALEPAGRLLTPPFAPLRYDTSFYTLELPTGESPEVDGEELVSGAWWRPEAALARWRTDAFPLPPPTLAYLRLLSQHGAPARAAEAARATDARPHHERFHIELHPGVYALPLRAPTLPPATTQNCFLFDGATVVVVDPGTPYEEERVPLFHTLDALTRDGRGVTVVLTHHHRDHVGSAQAVKERYHARVMAHADTAARLPQGLVDALLSDGESLDLGAWEGRPWLLTALHTPGHAPGHLALRDGRWGALLTGDLVSGVSTILVDPSEGDMREYMDSLARCAALDPPLALPGHGPLLPGAGAFLRTLEHRRMREGKVLAALAATPRTLAELTAIAYDDTPQEAWPLAQRSLLSHLMKLEKEGRATRHGDAWGQA